MRIHSHFIGLLLALVCGPAGAQGTATWIWSPGDFEIRLSNRMQLRRVERDVAWPPFRRLYGHRPQVNFMRQVDGPLRGSQGRCAARIPVHMHINAFLDVSLHEARVPCTCSANTAWA